MSLYFDTSCFLKLLFTEPETARVVELITAESKLVVSTLTRLEALVQIRGRVSPTAFEGPTFSGITGTQGPTR